MQGGELGVVVSGVKRGVGEEIVLYVEREDGRRFENQNERNEGNTAGARWRGDASQYCTTICTQLRAQRERSPERGTTRPYCLPP